MLLPGTVSIPGYEIQVQLTDCAETVRAVDSIRLLSIIDLMFVVIYGRDKCCLSVRKCASCVFCVFFDLRRQPSHRITCVATKYVKA